MRMHAGTGEASSQQQEYTIRPPPKESSRTGLKKHSYPRHGGVLLWGHLLAGNNTSQHPTPVPKPNVTEPVMPVPHRSALEPQTRASVVLQPSGSHPFINLHAPGSEPPACQYPIHCSWRQTSCSNTAVPETTVTSAAKTASPNLVTLPPRNPTGRECRWKAPGDTGGRNNQCMPCAAPVAALDLSDRLVQKGSNQHPGPQHTADRPASKGNSKRCSSFYRRRVGGTPISQQKGGP